MTRPSLGEIPGMRPEIESLVDELLQHWSRPGASLTARQRTALVDVVRAARVAPGLPPWESPRDHAGLLPADLSIDDALVDAAWKISMHPGTLTREWYAAVLANGVEPSTYVEVVGVVSMANALEHLCNAVGSFAPPLLTPNDGPTGGSTVSGRISSHWVPTIESDLPNVRTALSVSPGEMAMQGNVLDAFYVPGGALALDLDAKVWSLERTQLELVAARVSTLNECFY